MKKLLGFIISMLAVGVVGAADRVPTNPPLMPVMPASKPTVDTGSKITFKHVQTLQQTKTEGHETHCSYYALYFATRFAAMLPKKVVGFPHQVASPQAVAAFSECVNDGVHAGKAISRWEGRVAAFRAAGRSHNWSVNCFDLPTNLSETEISQAIIDHQQPGVPGFLESAGLQAGQLAVFGSLGDLAACITNNHFSFERIGKSMQAFQRGLPVGFIVNIGSGLQGHNEATHFVAIGLQRTGNDVAIYTMDSVGNSFEYQPTAHYAVYRDDLGITREEFDLLGLGQVEAAENEKRRVFCQDLQKSITSVVQFMLANDPIWCEVGAQFRPRCIEVLTEMFVEGTMLAANNPQFEALLSRRCLATVSELLKYADALELMKVIALDCFSQQSMKQFFQKEAPCFFNPDGIFAEHSNRAAILSKVPTVFSDEAMAGFFVRGDDTYVHAVHAFLDEVARSIACRTGDDLAPEKK